MADCDYNLPPTIVEDINQLHVKIKVLEERIAHQQMEVLGWKGRYENIKNEYDTHFLVWLKMKCQAREERGSDEANSEALQEDN